MGEVSFQHRRDPRTELAPKTASVEFDWEGSARTLRGEVLTVSPSGLAFVLADSAAIEPKTLLTEVTLHLREAIIQGDLSVRYVRRTKDSEIEIGCLFYPASLDDSALWMQLVGQRPKSGSSPPPQLMLRCSTCHSTIWICDTDRSTHSCPACRQEYGLERPLRGRQLKDLHLRASRMAIELGIDLASAVSMLLGTLTLAVVRDILDEAPAAEPEAADEGKKRRYDPAFQPAIDAGALTEHQAVVRGNRDAFARKLVARHRISLDAAYAVADNRTTLLTILRQRKRSETLVARYEPARSPARRMAVAAVAAIALLIGIGAVRQFDRAMNHPTPEPETRRKGAVARSDPDASVAPDLRQLPVDAYARVRKDERGEILGVEATDPGNALLAFCRSQGPERRLEPVDVFATNPPSDFARLGVLRDLDDGEDYRVVVIRRDPQTRRWLLGNADNPDAGVSMFPAPERLVQQATELQF